MRTQTLTEVAASSSPKNKGCVVAMGGDGGATKPPKGILGRREFNISMENSQVLKC